jgi:putative transposase
VERALAQRTLASMPRTPRYELPEGPVHAFTRAIRTEPLFVTQADANEFLRRLSEAFERFRVSCWAYTLMPTHYHLVVDGRRDSLSAALHRLNGGYAHWFNREHGYRGHLFGDRFGARAIKDETYLLEVVRYVVLNPVRAGLCTHPREWRWSSYAATLGRRSTPAFLDLGWMDGVISPGAFVAFVDDRLAPVELAA